MSPTVETELREAIDRIIQSTSKKKLVVAGPAAGKTTLFRKLLEATEGEAEDRLVLTFINNLRADLERSLGDVASVFTLHGYCQSLLRRDARLRNGLTQEFRCYPGLISLVKQDWEWLAGGASPTFVDQMRERCG
jgi:superfamily I DNA/RNA helicase